MLNYFHNFFDRVLDIFIKSLIFFAKKLPYHMRIKVFGFLVGYIVAPIFGYNRKATKNLRLVFPKISNRQIKKMARNVSVNFGKNIIENYSKDDMELSLKYAHIGGDGLQILQQEIANKRPVLLVSGHIGNYEAIRVALHNMGYQSAGLYRPAKNTFFNQHYVQSLRYKTGPVFSQDRKGFLSFIRYLMKGGIGALLFDVRSNNHVNIDFLGISAPTSIVPAEIALKAGALLLPCFAHRLPDGITHAIEFEAPIQHGSARDMAIEMNKRLESQVLRYPDQWLWIHDRWGSDTFRKARALQKEVAHD